MGGEVGGWEDGWIQGFAVALLEADQVFDSLKSVKRQLVFGGAVVAGHESCNALALFQPTSLIVLGNSEPNGLFAQVAADMTGFAMAVDKNELTQGAGKSHNKRPRPSTNEEHRQIEKTLESYNNKN